MMKRIEYKKSFRRVGLAFLIGSPLVGFLLAWVFGVLVGGVDHEGLIKTAVVWFGALFGLSAVPMVLRPEMVLHADDERISLKSPSRVLGQSFSIASESAKAVMHRTGMEGEDEWVLVTDDGRVFLLPSTKGFPVVELREFVADLRRREEL